MNICDDNRFEIIEKAKEALLDSTNIEQSPDEMKVLDNFLFRCWQMGWLDKYESKKNDSWIPCSERLPELRKDCLVTVKYSGFMGMHGIWIKTGHMEKEGVWRGDCCGGKVIAWMPLPPAYKEGE